jgi:hypothetical protein
MRRLPQLWFGLAFALGCFAQATAEKPADQTKAEVPAATASAAASEAKPAAAAESPVPDGESWLTGSIDFGYRWRTDIAGNPNVYRSIVNLGSGPKLLGTDFKITDPKHRLFDTLETRAYTWGGEPYQTLQVNIRKQGVYDLNGAYRDFAYFNNLPSFANPLLSRGIYQSQRAFDLRRKLSSFQLDMRPGSRFIPYVAFERASGFGNGVTTLVSDANEYAVPTRLDEVMNNFRAGGRLELRRFHATIEQGGTTFDDRQNVFETQLNSGNRTLPYLGQTLGLRNMLATYGVNGTSYYSKALFSAQAASWLDLYGQYLYSRPESTLSFNQSVTGNNVVSSQLLFYTQQQYLVSSFARLPHTSGSFGAELRPFSRLRLVSSWLTDRVSVTGAARTNERLTTASGVTPLGVAVTSGLTNNYSQAEVMALYDVTRKINLRGGYRRVWSDARQFVLPQTGLPGTDASYLRRDVALGGATWRPFSKLSLNADAEVARSGQAYFRTSLYDYQRLSARARYQLLKELHLSGDFWWLNNQNPTPASGWDFNGQRLTTALLWTPKGGKWVSLQGDYTRATLRSDISFLVPQQFTREWSRYRDNAHIISALAEMNLPHKVKLAAGGSMFLSSGSRPTDFYQPRGRLSVPIYRGLAWISEWRYDGYGEPFYQYEGFRTHLITTGLRVTR